MEYLPALAKDAERQEMLGGFGLIDFDIPEKRSDFLAAGQTDFNACQSTRKRLNGQFLHGRDRCLAGLIAIGELPNWMRSEICRSKLCDVFHVPANVNDVPWRAAGPTLALAAGWVSSS